MIDGSLARSHQQRVNCDTQRILLVFKQLLSLLQQPVCLLAMSAACRAQQQSAARARCGWRKQRRTHTWRQQDDGEETTRICQWTSEASQKAAPTCIESPSLRHRAREASSRSFVLPVSLHLEKA